MPRTRQFKGTSQRRTFFDRKVTDTGYTRTVSMGKIIPEDWTYVRITPVQVSKTSITVKIDKLLGEEKLACYPSTCKRSGQDT